MRKILFVILLLPLAMMAQSLHIQSPVRFLALGDSYTIGESVAVDQRWPNQLKDSLAVRGIVTDTIKYIATTGWRTDNLINAITNQNLESQHYNLVSLLIGVNNQYQGRPISQYQMEFKQLLDSAIRYAGGDTSHVFIVSIPDYAYTPFGQQGGSASAATISTQLDQYNAIAKAYADSFHIRYFDITPISRQGLMDTSLVAGDGLHPSGKQYAKWVKLMMDYVDSDTTHADTTHTGINKATQATIEVYPNPITNDVVINLGAAYDANTLIEIYDMNGKLVTHQKATVAVTTISTAQFAKGIYTVKVSSKDKQFSRKLLKN